MTSHGGERREGELLLLHLVPRYKLDVCRSDVDFGGLNIFISLFN